MDVEIESEDTSNHLPKQKLTCYSLQINKKLVLIWELVEKLWEKSNFSPDNKNPKQRS